MSFYVMAAILIDPANRSVPGMPCVGHSIASSYSQAISSFVGHLTRQYPDRVVQDVCPLEVPDAVLRQALEDIPVSEVANGVRDGQQPEIAPAISASTKQQEMAGELPGMDEVLQPSKPPRNGRGPGIVRIRH